MAVMPETLTFQHVYQYSLRAVGITVPVRLDYAGKYAEFTAKVDTGASYCIFSRFHGEELGLNIEQGTPEEISTVMGNFQVYGHPVTLTVLGLALDTTVYFAADEHFTRNVLGRQAWLNLGRLGLVDYEGTLYLSHYDDPQLV
jgi:hypothetical protein